MLTGDMTTGKTARRSQGVTTKATPARGMDAASLAAYVHALQSKAKRLGAVRDLRKRQLADVEVELGAVYDELVPLLHTPK